ncbi:winged helix-turn-helix domain-containing protein [Flavobacterium sp. PLA-1-15]|uniref:winged helix-turn-helix domain-containing protein n=1 Tax=Flavobacterium sp. PLA-1-15 TaxID=3380533 RepID=UPI003B9805B8
MKQRKIYFYGSLCLAILSAVMLMGYQNSNEVQTALIKIALRDAGNKLLLTNQDSTSLVLPIQKLGESKYRLSFQKELTINPDSVVAIIERSFQKANLSSHYQIEVRQCQDFEVTYSYQKNKTEEKSIIPCSGRFLPQKCYLLEVQFLEKTASSTAQLIWMVLLIGSSVMAFVLFLKRKTNRRPISANGNSIAVGKFQFYPDENKLIVASTEIPLSKKEVELLTVFVENPNKVIKREELSKKVWEDHGVFVGRSLDTYISKLRKKLSDDTSIKLTNVHGIGYMLEVRND